MRKTAEQRWEMGGGQKRRSSRHQDKEEKVSFTERGESRMMGVCEQNRSKDPTGQSSNGYARVLHIFDFIFRSGEKIDKGQRHRRAFCLVLSSAFNGAFRAGEERAREGEEDTREQRKQMREDRLCALRDAEQY